jgi:hypothetical protein
MVWAKARTSEATPDEGEERPVVGLAAAAKVGAMRRRVPWRWSQGGLGSWCRRATGGAPGSARQRRLSRGGAAAVRKKERR